MYNNSLELEFDPDKDQINRAKHGVALALADYFEWDSAISALDSRYSYGEPRFVAYGLIGDRVHCMVYTPRGETLRLISLRKAHKREVNDYVEQTQDCEAERRRKCRDQSWHCSGPRHARTEHN
ncbi:BrnT family toxin [Paraburkholderia sp. BL10I2N1]|uniref:BrnT family toxin n=1 Tax=Paraburkholderia sp. BL10I2N1 TaxID=1938796 RepID=UPI0032618FAB